MTTILISVWLAFAALFLFGALIEGISLGEGRWNLWRIAGLLACIAWPVALPLFVVAAMLHRRAGLAAYKAGARPKLVSRV